MRGLRGEEGGRGEGRGVTRGGGGGGRGRKNAGGQVAFAPSTGLTRTPKRPFPPTTSPPKIIHLTPRGLGMGREWGVTGYGAGAGEGVGRGPDRLLQNLVISPPPLPPPSPTPAHPTSSAPTHKKATCPPVQVIWTQVFSPSRPRRAERRRDGMWQVASASLQTSLYSLMERKLSRVNFFCKHRRNAGLCGGGGVGGGGTHQGPL